MKKDNLTDKQIIERGAELGFSKEQIDFIYLLSCNVVNGCICYILEEAKKEEKENGKQRKETDH